MKGLLKFCYEATKGEDAPDHDSVLKEMDPQRLKWLEEALSGMSVDVVEQLGNGIKILNSSTEDLDSKEIALDCLEDWVGQLDMAANFHKIGGFTALQSCLESPEPSLRAGAAHLAAECSQNNPYCQEKFVQENFLDKFVSQLDKDCDPAARVKALYAISCICRDNPTGLAAFAALQGWSVVLRAIQSGNNKLRIKACFFVTAVAPGDEKIQEELVELGVVEQLVQLLQEDHNETHEHVMSGLVSLARNNKAARDRVATEEVAKMMMERQEMLKGREECEEELEYCKELARLCCEEGGEKMGASMNIWGHLLKNPNQFNKKS